MKKQLESLIDKRSGFNVSHVIRVLFLLDEHVGRKRICETLGIGEASVKTLFKRLKEVGWISSTKKGHKLTEEGRKIVQKILKVMEKPVEITMKDYGLGKRSFVTVVRKACKKVKMGIEQRDEAIKIGGEGAITLIVKDGKLIFPGTGEVANENLAEIIKRLFKLNDCDVVIIGFAKQKNKAEEATLMAALSLV